MAERGFHGEMSYMARHGAKRSRPAELLPGTVSCISVRMDYWPRDAADATATLADAGRAYVSRYALGRDYHTLMRRRLQRLCQRIEAAIDPSVTACSPTARRYWEKALARNAGLGWIGKHTNLIDRRAGSYFFLGEIYVDLALPSNTPAGAHCGSCSACLPACPTEAIVAPYRLDARRCISYLTIELRGAIPIEFAARSATGSTVATTAKSSAPGTSLPWVSAEPDFAPRHGLDTAGLVDLFGWSEAEFLDKTAGSAIRRIGHERWLRNLAVALGNAPTSPAVLQGLRARVSHPSALVREHVAWALEQHSGVVKSDR